MQPLFVDASRLILPLFSLFTVLRLAIGHRHCVRRGQVSMPGSEADAFLAVFRCTHVPSLHCRLGIHMRDK